MRGGWNRRAAERSIPDLVDRVRAEPSARVVVIADDTAPLAAPDALDLVTVDRVPGDARWAFLGRDDDGAALLVAALPDSAPAPFAAPAGWSSLRGVAGGLDPAQADAFITALSLARWLRDAPHCPACGALTELRSGGWSRSCPACGREHFPRTDPAVIVAVTGARRPDRLLLGSNALWEAERYSCFAGFAEAGESLEDTVAREVHEEAGVQVVDIAYVGSQAWPYPRSLMIGFQASAVADAAARPDGEEILDVRWFTPGEIGDALEGRGSIRLPGPASIAHRLIRRWHAEHA